MISLNQAPLTKNTKVFVAADLDVPLKDGSILDTYRLDCMAETLEYLVQKGASVLLAGHIKQPHGVPNPDLSTKHLSSYFAQKYPGANIRLLENLRFDLREEENDPVFAQELASLADIYVNEIFDTSHRLHTSIVGVPKLLPSYAGFHLQKTVDTLKKVLENPNRPLVVIIGGAKLESKKPAVTAFLKLADYVLLGGKIGLDWTDSRPTNLQLPIDYAQDNKDIGPQTIAKFTQIIKTARTVVWAGPLGAYEDPSFLQGTQKIAEALAVSSAFSIVGGGDTVAALKMVNQLQHINFVSTGGSAMLQFLATGTLPGLEALNNNG